jgi:hypothetical protein
VFIEGDDLIADFKKVRLLAAQMNDPDLARYPKLAELHESVSRTSRDVHQRPDLLAGRSGMSTNVH